MQTQSETAHVHSRLHAAVTRHALLLQLCHPVLLPQQSHPALLLLLCKGLVICTHHQALLTHYMMHHTRALAAAQQHAVVTCKRRLTQLMYKVACTQKSPTPLMRSRSCRHMTIADLKPAAMWRSQR